MQSTCFSCLLAGSKLTGKVPLIANEVGLISRTRSMGMFGLPCWHSDHFRKFFGQYQPSACKSTTTRYTSQIEVQAKRWICSSAWFALAPAFSSQKIVNLTQIFPPGSAYSSFSLVSLKHTSPKHEPSLCGIALQVPSPSHGSFTTKHFMSGGNVNCLAFSWPTPSVPRKNVLRKKRCFSWRKMGDEKGAKYRSIGADRGSGLTRPLVCPPPSTINQVRTKLNPPQGFATPPLMCHPSHGGSEVPWPLGPNL